MSKCFLHLLLVAFLQIGHNGQKEACLGEEGDLQLLADHEPSVSGDFGAKKAICVASVICQKALPVVTAGQAHFAIGSHRANVDGAHLWLACPQFPPDPDPIDQHAQ